MKYLILTCHECYMIYIWVFFLWFYSVSENSPSTGPRCHYSARIIWRAPWTWSWDRRSSSAQCWRRSWETAQCACTAHTVMAPNRTALAGTLPALETLRRLRHSPKPASQTSYNTSDWRLLKSVHYIMYIVVAAAVFPTTL